MCLERIHQQKMQSNPKYQPWTSICVNSDLVIKECSLCDYYKSAHLYWCTQSNIDLRWRRDEVTVLHYKVHKLRRLPSVGIEPTTLGLLDPRSNQLSYEGTQWPFFGHATRRPMTHDLFPIISSFFQHTFLFFFLILQFLSLFTSFFSFYTFPSYSSN